MKYLKAITIITIVVMLMSSIMIAENVNVNYTHINQAGKNGSLNTVLSKYGLNPVHQDSTSTKVGNDAPFLAGINMTDKVLNTTWTSYNSTSDNIHGLAVTESVNGKIIHQAILVGNETNMTLIPIYSSSGNYNILRLGYNSSTSNQINNRNVSNQVWVNFQAYKLTNGYGYNQQMTMTLLKILTVIAALGGLAGQPEIVAALVIGDAVIGWYDYMGGENGISITSFSYQVLWWTETGYAINAPFDPSGSNVIGIITVWSGNIP